jgi:hypothetical protein
VREAGGERAEGDQRPALTCRRLDGARGAVQPLDEVAAEREPGGGQLTEHVGRDPQHPPAGHDPPGREVHALIVPRAEPARPAAGNVHPRDQGVLAAAVAVEVDGTLDEHPPEVRMLALAEQLVAGHHAYLGTAIEQVGELIVGEALEEAQSAELVGVHQIVAR